MIMVLAIVGFIQKKAFRYTNLSFTATNLFQDEFFFFQIAKEKKILKRKSEARNLPAGQTASNFCLCHFVDFFNKCLACDRLFSTAGTVCVVLRTEKISMYSAESRPSHRPHPTPPDPTLTPARLLQKINKQRNKRRQEEEKS